MIALCEEHHAKADAGTFTRDQLRELKVNLGARALVVKGSFDWMRRSLLGVVGGHFYYETPILIQVQGNPVIWINRDEEGYLLLNLRMISLAREPRAFIADNFWMSLGDPTDLVCPPHGRTVKISYANGDKLGVEFKEVETPDAFEQRWGVVAPDEIMFPLLTVEVTMNVAGTPISFGPRETKLGGTILRNNFSIRNGVGLSI
jgi:hypothetical protein